jgi:hypothetical protein
MGTVSSSDSSLSLLRSETLLQITSLIQRIISSSPPPSSSQSHAFSQSFAQVTSELHNNYLVEKCFKDLWCELYLQYLPPSLYHYPQYEVISCNVNILIQNCTKDFCRPSHSSATTTTSLDHTATTASLEQQQRQRQRIDFLESMINSKGFESLLQRHGRGLDYWNQKLDVTATEGAATAVE